MSEIIKKSGGTPAISEFEPMRLMREMLRWDPFREMAPVLSSFERVAAFNPSFDVTETKDAYVFKADVPGVKQEEIEITTTGNRLQISGKREFEQETKNETVYAFERQYGSFARSFTMPDGADLDHAKTELKDGVLTLVVPKLAEAQTRKIPISAGATKS